MAGRIILTLVCVSLLISGVYGERIVTYTDDQGNQVYTSEKGEPTSAPKRSGGQSVSLPDSLDGPIGRKALGVQALTLLHKREFSKLEEMANHFRDTKERFPDGAWKLNFFYDGFGSDVLTTDSAWLQTIDDIEAWQRLFADSPTPKIALARAWIGYAWFARGGGYQIKPGGLEPYENRLVRAAAILSDSSLDRRCPHTGVLRLILARTSGAPREEFERLFRAAIAIEPRYHGYYASANTYYLERWYGRPREWVKQLERSL